MTELPESWVDVEIIEVLAPHENGRPFQQGWSPQCERHPAEPGTWGVLKTTAIQHGEFWPHENKALPQSLDPRPQIEIKVGDILMTCAGPRNRCGVACLVEATPARLMMSGKMYRFRPRPEALDPKFLAYLIHRRDTQLEIDKMKTGISDSGLNLTHDRFAQLRLPLPPLPEQHRIVAKIEALFSELDAGQDSLTRAQAQLRLYRQSLLKAAFQGRLTADWRAANPDKLETPETLLSRIRSERDARYKQALDDWQHALSDWRAGGELGRKPGKPSRPRDFRDDLSDIEIDLPELPDGWAWGRLGYATCGVEYGTSAKSSVEGDVPVIRMGNLQNGLIDWADLVFTSDQDEIEQYLLSDGDVLFNRTNSPELVGKTAIYRGERPALFAGYLVRVNQIDTIALPEYICYFLNSHQARRHGDTVKTDGVNQSNINGNKLQEYPFPFCSAEEQAQLVLILDEKISAINAIETEITTALAKITALRQSILKQAFSGRLVPQDPADEPASALLARLRETAPPARAKRKTTA